MFHAVCVQVTPWWIVGKCFLQGERIKTRGAAGSSLIAAADSSVSELSPLLSEPLR